MSKIKKPKTLQQRAQKTVEKLAKQGKSSREIEVVLKKKFGSSYRRTELLSDIRRYVGKPDPTPERREKATPIKYQVKFVFVVGEIDPSAFDEVLHEHAVKAFMKLSEKELTLTLKQSVEKMQEREKGGSILYDYRVLRVREKVGDVFALEGKERAREIIVAEIPEGRTKEILATITALVGVTFSLVNSIPSWESFLQAVQQSKNQKLKEIIQEVVK